MFSEKFLVMDFKITGRIIEIGEIQQVSDNFKKRNCVIEYIRNNPQYPEYITFEFIKDKCGLLDDFSLNQFVEIFFNLKGRKWTNASSETKYFNSIQAWKIEEATEGKYEDDNSSKPSSEKTEKSKYKKSKDDLDFESADDEDTPW